MAVGSAEKACPNLNMACGVGVNSGLTGIGFFGSGQLHSCTDDADYPFEACQTFANIADNILQVIVGISDRHYLETAGNGIISLNQTKGRGTINGLAFR